MIQLYLWKPSYLHFKAMVVKMPVHDDREDISHCFCAERVNRDDVKMPQEPRSDFIPAPTGRAHGWHK